ncbi:MAG: Mov34/MPN/PAD-1 family protein [Myxococcota bacterium]
MGAEITLQWGEATLVAMRDAVRSAYPEEACGFLLGHGELVERVLPVANVAADRRRGYLMAPAALLAAHREASARGLEVLGVFHSHPNGAARLSARDEHLAQAGWVYAVVATRGAEPSDLAVRRL